MSAKNVAVSSRQAYGSAPRLREADSHSYPYINIVYWNGAVQRIGRQSRILTGDAKIVGTIVCNAKISGGPFVSALMR